MDQHKVFKQENRQDRMDKKFGDQQQRPKRSNRTTTYVIAGLIVVILILLGVIAYAFLIVPGINGYVINKQVEAKDVVLNTIIAQVQQQGYTTISDAEGNTLVLVPLTQEQLAQAQAQAQGQQAPQAPELLAEETA